MPTINVLSQQRVEEGGRDSISEAVERLERALPPRADAAVVVELLEDDLREGLLAISDVEAHFTDVLDTLRGQRLSPITLLEVSDDQRALAQLENLLNVVTRVRRRMSQAAGQLKRG